VEAVEPRAHTRAGVPAERRDGTHGTAEQLRGPRDVERLAAGQRDDLARSVDRADLDVLDEVCDIQRGRQAETRDHVSAAASSSRVACAPVPPADRVERAPAAAA